MIKANEIKIVSLSKLKARPNNRKKHPKEQIEALAKQIEVQGFRNPIIVSNQSGQIVCGTGRYLAAKKAKLKEVPVIYQDYDSEDLEWAHHVADNGLSLWSSLDLAGVNEDMSNLDPSFDIELIGIADFTLDIADKLDTDVKINDKIDGMSFITCPHCHEEFEKSQAKKRKA